MSALSLPHYGRIGFESRRLTRRPHRFDLQAEELEFRQLLSTGQFGVAASPVSNQGVAVGTTGAAVVSTAPAASVSTSSPQPGVPAVASANPTTVSQANLPTDNSSTINTPSVSPTIPEPLNVVTDDSASVTTSPTAAVTALIPNATSPFTDPTDEEVFLVPDPVPPTTIQLVIATPGAQLNNAEVTLHAINAPVGFQANNNSSVVGGAQNQQPTPMQRFGQSQATVPSTAISAHIGPEPTDPALVEGAEPFQSTQPNQTAAPPTAPGQTAPPVNQTPPTQQTTPAPDASPVSSPTPAPAPQPAQGGTPPAGPGSASPTGSGGSSSAGSGASASATMAPSMDDHTELSTLFGVAAISGGGFHLAMRESARFGMRSLPRQAGPPRAGRSRLAVR